MLVLQEIRQAMRALAAQPAWTVAALVCLAIGTGANTATFRLINGVLLRPLAFDQPHQIVMMAIRASQEQHAGPVSLEQFREVRKSISALQQLAVRTYLPVALSYDGAARMVQAEFVSGEYFDLLRVRPHIGQLLAADTDRAGAPLEGVISELLWRSRFGGGSQIIGKTIRVNGRQVTVRGVAPAGFVGAMRLIAADLWLPAQAYGSFASPEFPRDANTRRVFGLIGRMRDGLSITQARQQTDAALLNQWRSIGSPGTSAPESAMEVATGFGVPPGVKSVATRGTALIFGLMAMLIAVAIANVAGLMLARSTGRQKEIAVRLALGASRYHIARQVFIESLLLALGGAVFGALLAATLPSVLDHLAPNLPEHLRFAVDVQPDWGTGVYSILTAVVMAVLFGLAPARRAAAIRSSMALRESTGNSRSHATSRSLNAFVSGQIAVSTLLLVIAILLGRTYVNTQAVDPGIDIRNTLAVSLDWDQTGTDRSKGRAFFQKVVSRIGALPGIQSVALTQQQPLSPGGITTSVTTEKGVFAADANVVTPDYFETVRLPLLSGRGFLDSDSGGKPVAIVNETMARQLSRGDSPVGQSFAIGNPERRVEVIGVVKNAKYRSLSEAPRPVYYEPFSQHYSPQMTLLVRTQADPQKWIERVGRELETENRDLAASAIRTMEDQFQQSVAPSQQGAILVGMTCGLGVLLSAFGLFGVMSYGVRLRVRELGIRMAVGARPANIAAMVFGQAFRLVGLGVSVGLLLAYGTTRILERVLFGVATNDPLTIALVVTLLAGVAVLAAFPPVRWAMKLDPVRSMRTE